MLSLKRLQMASVLVAAMLLPALPATLPAAQAQARALPSPTVSLAGLKSVNVRILVSSDARQGLKTAGEHPTAVEEALEAIARQKLALVGVALQSVVRDRQAGSEGSALTIGVDTDITTGSFMIVVNLEEPVTLVRPPNTKMTLTTWSAVQHPGSNEMGPIKDTVADILDRFDADYLSANPRSPAGQ
ncbi:MAG TPA: hypothetical protein V6D08_18950 [Candidatus Obscuribacterales bacterium]